jgi:hypothetical protein
MKKWIFKRRVVEFYEVIADSEVIAIQKIKEGEYEKILATASIPNEPLIVVEVIEEKEKTK